MAYRFATEIAKCGRVDNIRTSSALTSILTAPYICTANGVNVCQYYGNNTLLFSLNCECGFNTAGYCPLPMSDQLGTYISNIAPLAKNTKCHAIDRNNILAQQDCGLGASTNKSSIALFKTATNALFNFQYYTYTITQAGRDCLHSVFPTSYEQMTAFAHSLTGASFIILGGMAMISTGWL